jgi:excinuclease ABC subunit A
MCWGSPWTQHGTFLRTSNSFFVLSKCCGKVGLVTLDWPNPATGLSGGEAQRIKLATELQRVQRGATLYVLDERTTGLHVADVDKLMAQLNALVTAGNTVI